MERFVIHVDIGWRMARLRRMRRRPLSITGCRMCQSGFLQVLLPRAMVQALTCDLDSNMSEFDSGASDMTTISIPSKNSSADSIALAAQNAVLKAEIRQLEQKIIDTARVTPYPAAILTC